MRAPVFAVISESGVILFGSRVRLGEARTTITWFGGRTTTPLAFHWRGVPEVAERVRRRAGKECRMLAKTDRY